MINYNTTWCYDDQIIFNNEQFNLVVLVTAISGLFSLAISHQPDTFERWKGYTKPCRHIEDTDSKVEEEKFLPQIFVKKICMNGTFFMVFLLLIATIIYYYFTQPLTFVYLVKTTDVNKFSAIKAVAVYGGDLLYDGDAGCLEKLELNPKQQVKASNHILCANFKGNCTEDTKK